MANLGDRGPGPGPAGRGPVGPQIGPDGPKIRVWAISRATRGVFTRLKKFSTLKIWPPDRLATVPGPNSTVRDPAGAPEVPGLGPGRPARPGPGRRAGSGTIFEAKPKKIWGAQKHFLRGPKHVWGPEIAKRALLGPPKGGHLGPKCPRRGPKWVQKWAKKRGFSRNFFWPKTL